MPCVFGFEPAIPASERAKTVHALDRLATVTGGEFIILVVIINNKYYGIYDEQSKRVMHFKLNFAVLVLKIRE
jgi:hypothetical protein